MLPQQKMPFSPEQKLLQNVPTKLYFTTSSSFKLSQHFSLNQNSNILAGNKSTASR
jgi:hypothetical protein